MSDEAALLRAIHAEPDDDTPRLVYADWLDEHDQPERAEFIRVQITLSRSADNNEEFQRLYSRNRELSDTHRAKWLREFEPFDAEKIAIDFTRGFPEAVRISNATAIELKVLQKLPGLRALTWDGGTMTPAIVRAIAGMKHLDSLQISDTPFRRQWLALLEPLACGTVVRIYPRGAQFGNAVWNAFQERRLAKFAKLPPAEQRKEALRYLRYFEHDATGLTAPVVTRAYLSQTSLCDAEMQLFAAVPELEEFYNSESSLTAAGLAHLARLPKLKSLELFSVQVESITPLAGCTTLEKLELYPEYEIVVGDDGTEGLERLTNLRELMLRDGYGEGGYGDRTLARLAPLRKLRALDIELRYVQDPESYAALARLTALERLCISGDLPSAALRFLAPLRRLKTLSLSVASGPADAFRHLAGLTELSVLDLGGGAVTDAAVQHLAPLKNLRTIRAQGCPITRAGAQALADQLPGVTIVLAKHVVKSPRPKVTMRRRAVDGFASARFPTHWYDDTRNFGSSSIWVSEDGWENVGSWSGGVVGPCAFRLYVTEGDAKTAIRACVQNNSHANPRVRERNVVKLPGADTASCVYRNSFGQYLVCAIALAGNCAVLVCEAPPSRFEEFRPLFLHVARSLRAGTTAMKNVGEEKTVVVSRL